MSLKESQALTNVHPALAERMRFMRQVIDFWGGGQIYLSGFRSIEQQEQLFNRDTQRPTAAPGCSQHQYGFAVDVIWNPIFDFGRNIAIHGKELVEVMSNLGRQLGLTVVANDPGHFQVFPGAQFKAWAVASDFCDPNAVPIRPAALFPHPDGQVVTRSDGSRTWVWNTTT